MHGQSLFIILRTPEQILGQSLFIILRKPSGGAVIFVYTCPNAGEEVSKRALYSIQTRGWEGFDEKSGVSNSPTYFSFSLEMMRSDSFESWLVLVFFVIFLMSISSIKSD
ncbi:hypothetical protein AVEN_256270-1 [Araneus ventricosus]|uniref:Uncharacterized protein n=1 Tax=Araneus ventricosus TaxID=182803 RepID=A0A4Y2RFX6_ARAVE|nr:hypothetical protein AVEN_256270-1 [Araneus ventricosus]